VKEVILSVIMAFTCPNFFYKRRAKLKKKDIPKSKSQREVRKKKNVRERKKKNSFFLRVFGIGLRENYLESLSIFSYYNEKIINRFLRYN